MERGPREGRGASREEINEDDICEQQMFTKKFSHISLTLTCHGERLDKRTPMQIAMSGLVGLIVTSQNSCLIFFFLNTVSMTRIKV